MAKSNFYSCIAAAIVSTLLLCSCERSVTLDVVGNVDYSVVDEPEVIQVITNEPVKLSLEEKKALHRKIYRSFIGVREATGNNDGPEVEMFLKHEGLGKGYAWCAAFVSFGLDSAGFENTITAWSPTAENKKALVYSKGQILSEAEPGNVFTIYYPKKKRIGHTGYFDGWASDKLIETVEGNTNSNKSREGDGVYVVFRPLGTIHSISSWYK